MSEDPIDRRPVRSTATLAGLVAILTALAVGLSIGDPLPVVTSVAGALLLAGGAWALNHDSNGRIAVGSLALVAGTVGLALTVVFAAGGSRLAAYLGLAFGTALVLVDGVTDGVGGDSKLGSAIRESGNALLVGIVLAVVLNLNATFGVVSSLIGGIVLVATATPLWGFVTLQIGGILVLLLLNRVVPVLESWLPEPGGDDRPLDTLERTGLSSNDVPVAYWAVLAVQAFVAFTPLGQGLFTSFLNSVPVVGTLIRAAVGGPLHLLVVLVAAGLCAVLLASGLQRWVVDWLGTDPAETLALQTGGIAAVAVTIVGTLALPLVGISLLPARSSEIGGLLGPGAIVLGGLVAAVLTVGVAMSVVPMLSARGFLPRPAGGFALGSAVLFLTVLLGAELGVPTALVIAGAAATLLVWDAGAHGSSLGRQIGRTAGATDSEFVHVTGTGVVLVVAVLVALAARYLVVPVVAPPTTDAAIVRSSIALFLVVVAIVAFAVALAVRSDTPSLR